MKVIENHIDSIKELCNTYHVDKMYLFGSALNADFNEKSDIDFLVKFKAVALSGYFDNYFNFKEGLQNLFNRKVDLIEEQTLKNPILIRSINRNRELVYG